MIILKEGSSQSRGREAQRNNIAAARLIAELVSSSLGPRGMDKMLVDSQGDVTITNDGATMLKEIDVQHPAAKMLVEVSRATDNEVGDGTTSAVIVAGALLEKAEDLIDRDVHPVVIAEGYSRAAEKAQEILESIAEKIDPNSSAELQKVVTTSLMTKLAYEDVPYLAGIIVNAIFSVEEKTERGLRVDTDNVKLEKKPGGSLANSTLIKGIVLDKEVVHSGMPKVIEKAKIALISTPFEIEKTEFDAKLNINDPSMMKKFLDEETKMLKGMVDKVVEVGANVVVCQKGIDDIAQHYLAKAGVMAVRRARESDMTKLAKATGGRVVNNLEDLSPSNLGYAAHVEERKLEEDKWVFVEGCKSPKAVTILLRGGTQRVVDEAERSLRDALMVAKDVVELPAVVAGGGAAEEEVAFQLRNWAQSISGREQLAVLKFADAVETIPLTLAFNAGMDPIDAQVDLRAKHSLPATTAWKRAILPERLQLVDYSSVKRIENLLTPLIRASEVLDSGRLDLQPPTQSMVDGMLKPNLEDSHAQWEKAEALSASSRDAAYLSSHSTEVNALLASRFKNALKSDDKNLAKRILGAYQVAIYVSRKNSAVESADELSQTFRHLRAIYVKSLD